MRYCIYLIIGLILVNCDLFNPDRVENNQQGLKDIFEKALICNVVKIESNDKSELSGFLRKYSIYKMEIIFSDSLNMIGKDSIVIYTKSRGFLFTPQKNIIYDFANRPRSFGNQDYPNAAYHMIQINDRWYFETIGFD